MLCENPNFIVSDLKDTRYMYWELCIKAYKPVLTF